MNPRQRRAFLLAMAVAAVCGASAATAAPLKKGTYSRYEQESLDGALSKVHGVLDPNPEGKVLEGFVIVTLEVFERRDFIPRIFLGFVNFFHATTRRYVIEREVLLAPGTR